MALMNASVVETAPGAVGVHPFSPPDGWEGDADAYVGLMRRRFKDMNFRQEILFIAFFIRHGGETRFRGPFAKEAEGILDALCR